MMANIESAGRLVSQAPPPPPTRSRSTSSLSTIGQSQSQPQLQSQSQSQSQSRNVHRSTRHIWIITGPAGCGKSSVAQQLAKTLSLPYIEGDDYHPRRNVDKMANGIPLTDDDRWDWLETIREQAVHELENGAAGCVVTCSCLKRKYRDVIRVASGEADDVIVRFIYLKADQQLLLDRVGARKGHYMKGNMVASQFAALEEPDETETDVISIDVSGSLDSVNKATKAQVQRVMVQEKLKNLQWHLGLG